LGAFAIAQPSGSAGRCSTEQGTDRQPIGERRDHVTRFEVHPAAAPEPNVYKTTQESNPGRGGWK